MMGFCLSYRGQFGVKKLYTECAQLLNIESVEHLSVLKNETLDFLDLKSGEIVVDATLGLGGHAKEMVTKIGTTGTLIAFDQDERNLEEAKRRLQGFEGQIVYVHDNFRHLKTRITGNDFVEIDAILFDLGLSSPHVDDAARGFSFNKLGPLDMRFDPRSKLTAYDVVNAYSEEELARIIFEYGEDRLSRKIARKIVDQRKQKPFETTTELADFIEKVVPRKRSSKASKSHPATQTFQAIRIEVNDELDVVRQALRQAMELLKIGGRVVVISYHSLEDRIVKHFFKELEKPPAEGEQAMYSNHGDPFVKSLTKKPVVPSEEELEQNPRSRSAKLRAYRKLR